MKNPGWKIGGLTPVLQIHPKPFTISKISKTSFKKNFIYTERWDGVDIS